MDYFGKNNILHEVYWPPGGQQLASLKKEQIILDASAQWTTTITKHPLPI